MRNLSAQPGIGSDPAYLNGNLVDTQTIIGEGINQDLVQFFQKLAALASITPNNLPDNETNGYQLITALEAVVRSFAASTTQKGTSERATQTEVNTGSDTERYVTPDTLRGTTFVTAQIPNLSASKINSGTFDPARIPNLDASKIATGTFLADRIPGLDASKIISGFIDTDRIRQATTTVRGTLETATSPETILGSSTQLAVTPEGLKDTLDDKLGDILKTKVLDIGDWNMDTTVTKNVAHGLTFANIRSIRVLIRNDANTARYSFTDINVGGTTYQAVTADATNISMFRETGGIYDSANYDSTSYNRGWIIIEYV